MGKPFDQDRLLATMAALIERDKKPLPVFSILERGGTGDPPHGKVALCPLGIV